MELLAMYDIADPKRLRKIEKNMRRFGYRVQKSVFECSLSEPQIYEMKKTISKIMDLKEDAFRIYPLLADAREKQTLIGQGQVHSFKQLLIA